MNLHKLLAENMTRFGTKNLSTAVRRTLLNEGSAAGSAPEASFMSGVGATLQTMSSYNNVIGTWLQPYDGIKMPNDGGMDSLGDAALGALFMATFAKISADKKFAKAVGAANVNRNSLFQVLVGNMGLADSTQEEVLRTAAAETTKQITYAATKVDVYPSPKNAGGLATLGKATDTGVDKQQEQWFSDYKTLANYLTAFNMGNVLNDAPDYTQYNLSTMVDQNNFVNLLITGVESNKLIVYTMGDKIPGKAGKELTSTTVGASAPVSKQYDVSFDTGVATIPAGDAEVAKAVQDAIAMFPDGNISNLTVVSSASPEYNSAQGGPKTLADYGQNTTGTGDPGVGTDNIAKNKKLAYDRGVSFMTALNAGLEAQGKPAVTGYTVNWQISDKGGSKVPGRYAEVQWEKAGSKGTEVPGAKSTGTTGANVNLKATYNYNMHTFSW
jgi:hypothetical protein